MLIAFCIFAFLFVLGLGLIFSNTYNTAGSRTVVFTGVGLIGVALAGGIGFMTYLSLYVY